MSVLESSLSSSLREQGCLCRCDCRYASAPLLVCAPLPFLTEDIVLSHWSGAAVSGYPSRPFRLHPWVYSESIFELFEATHPALAGTRGCQPRVPQPRVPQWRGPPSPWEPPAVYRNPVCFELIP